MHQSKITDFVKVEELLPDSEPCQTTESDDTNLGVKRDKHNRE